MKQPAIRKVLGLGIAVVAMLGAISGFAQPASAQAPSSQQGVMTKVRLAHLSPDTEAMDIYAAGPDGVETKVLSSLSYRDVSQYVGVPVGFYAFKMRPAGSPADVPAVLSATALLEGGEAFTFAAFGPHAGMQTQLIKDDLRSPRGGATAVRVFQAAPDLGAVSVKVANGPELYSGLTVGAATDYSDVAAGTQTIIVTPEDPSVPAFESTVDLPAGGVVTLLVGGKTGSMALMAVVDASGTDLSASGASASVAPTGGVAAGGGGLAGLGSGSTTGSGGLPIGALAAVVLASALVLVAGATSATAVRRRAGIRA